jgi:hypothetical protein
MVVPLELTESPLLLVMLPFLLPYFHRRLLLLVQKDPPVGRREFVGIDEDDADEIDDGNADGPRL